MRQKKSSKKMPEISMLSLLRRILQEVNVAPDLATASDIIVKRVSDAIRTECCSIFLTDSMNRCYTLVASVGFKPESVGSVHIPFGEGIVSLVADREEPLNIEDASTHPNFKYFPETGEERFNAMMGVPIIHQRRVLGILVVQQQAKRRFDEGEEAFVVTVAAQLAPIISQAQGNQLPLYCRVGAHTEASILGVPGSPGVAIGIGVVVYPPADLDAVPDRIAHDIEAEIVRFREALQAARNDIHDISSRLSGSLPPEELLIFDAYLQILDSNSLGNEVEEEINRGHWAPGALSHIIKQHVRVFESMEDSYLRERAADLRDLGRRILTHLKAQDSVAREYPADTILVSEELTVSALADVPEGRLKGVISARGSGNSHVAILARALDIPAVMGVDTLRVTRLENENLIVDGYSGEIYESPSPALLMQYRARVKEESELFKGLKSLRELRAETPDGRRMPLYVNAGLVSDIRPSLNAGAEGVGLYRTEVPFMIRERFPSEEEQREIYAHLLNSFAPKPVTIRTLDVGGDKNLSYFPIVEENPFLGWRGIRITLDHPEIFLVQLRAMLRASVGLNNLRVLFPMISCVTEVIDAKALLKQAYDELKEEGLELHFPQVGAMVEVPSVVYQAREIAREVDFLSVGSNDLIQYILAVDRNNAHVANLYDSLHPSVLRALVQVVEGAHQENKPITICGEMAGEPITVILLQAMGFDALSMNSTSLPRVKWVIRNFTISQSREILAACLQMTHAREIRAYLQQILLDAGLGMLVRAKSN